MSDKRERADKTEIVNKVPEPRSDADAPRINVVPEPREKGNSSVDERERPRVTFMGNTYDVVGLGALASGVLVLLSCLTCGQLFYCLPVVPVLLGVLGLVMAKDAVDGDRTRAWSWLGIGTGGVAVLLFAAAVVGYFAFIIFIVAMSQS